jgi:hypothetical protein
MTDGTRPRARAGLLASDHSKRGRRFVTVVDPQTLSATLLEPWEHAVLVLCDGSRSSRALAELLAPDVDGQVIDVDVVRRCLKFFEREGLIDAAGLRESDAPPPGPVTLTELQRAYAEWHKSADGAPDTGLPPPIPRTSPKIAAGLEPTVSFGQRDKSLLTGVRSLLEAAPDAGRADDDAVDEDDMPDLLAAVDDAVAEASRVDQSQRAKRRAARRPADVQEGESRPLTSGLHTPPRAGVLIAPGLADDAPPSRSPPPSPKTTSVAPAAAPPPSPGAALAASAGSLAPPTSPPTVPQVRRAPPTEPTMRLIDLLGTDATEPATVLLQPASPFGSVHLRDEDTPPLDPPRPPRGPPRPAEQSPTQLGSLVKKR